MITNSKSNSESKSKGDNWGVKARKALFKYACFFLVLFILSRANIAGIKPFGFGAYLALVFSGASILILSPLYVLASVLGDFTLNSLICAVSMSIVLSAAQAIHFKVNRPIKIYQLLIYALIGQAGYIYVVIVSNQSLLNAVLSISLGTAFTLASACVFTAVFRHRLKYKLDKAESASLAILIAAIALGTRGLELYGLSLYVVMGVLFVLAITASLGNGYGAAAGLMWGIGGAFYLNQTAYAAIFALYSLIVSVFLNYNKIMAGIAALSVDILFGYYFNIIPNFSHMHIVSSCIGIAIFSAIPSKYYAKFGELLIGKTDIYAIRHIINRNRGETADRLKEISRVFSEMRVAFAGLVKGSSSDGEAALLFSDEIPKKLCEDCKNSHLCLKTRGEETMRCFSELMFTALKKGRISLLDIPQGLVSVCGRTAELINMTNTTIGGYLRYRAGADKLDAAKVLLSEQLGGLSDIIENLAEDEKKGVGFDVQGERRILEELTYADVVASEVMITREGGGVFGQNAHASEYKTESLFSQAEGLAKQNRRINEAGLWPTEYNTTVTLIVKTDTLKEGVILKIADKVMRQKMRVVSIEESAKAGFSLVTLKRAPRFDLAIGISGLNKNNAEVGGDTHSFTKISDERIMLALCDGMGSGKNAEKISNMAISLIENFYKAGFSTELIIASVNKLLTLALDESFSAIDIAVIDLNSAQCDFIKFGAPSSIIKHKFESEEVEGGNLPIGVVSEINPVITTRMLEPYDTVVLCTDGVSDVFKDDGDMAACVNNIRIANPQELAVQMVSYARGQDKDLPHDDMTCLAFKVLPA